MGDDVIWRPAAMACAYLERFMMSSHLRTAVSLRFIAIPDGEPVATSHGITYLCPQILPRQDIPFPDVAVWAAAAIAMRQRPAGFLIHST